VFEGDSPVMTKLGVPEWRVAMAPSSQWQVLDTGYATGLADSGSRDSTTPDLLVPNEHPFSLFQAARREEPFSACRGMFFANQHLVPLGLARRTIDTVQRLAGKKRVMPELVPQGDVPRLRAALVRAEVLLGAARA